MENRVVESKVLINESGRILIPINIRKALNLDVGDELLLRVEEEEVHIIPLAKAVQETQALVRKYNKNNLKLTDVLSALRREDADNE